MPSVTSVATGSVPDPRWSLGISAAWTLACVGLTLVVGAPLLGGSGGPWAPALLLGLPPLISALGVWYLLDPRRQDRIDDVDQALLDSMTDRILVLDSDLTILQANRKAREAWGTRLVGRKCYTACACRHDPCEECPAIGSFRDGRNRVVHRESPGAPAGELFELESRPIRSSVAGIPSVVVLARTITRERRLREQLLHQARMASVGVLAAGIAHDIGNPLASLSAELQLLDRNAGPERVQESLVVVRGEVDRITRSLRELVGLTRGRPGEPGCVSVNGLIQETLRLLHHHPRAAIVETTTDLDPEVPGVRCVEDHLMQALLNVLLNAMDSMESGGTLTVRTRSTDTGLLIEVEDSGCGMDRETLERVFEPFFTTRADMGGTGLGLYMVRDVVESTGGTVSIDSWPGRGTRVVLRLDRWTETDVTRGGDDADPRRGG